MEVRAREGESRNAESRELTLTPALGLESLSLLLFRGNWATFAVLLVAALCSPFTCSYLSRARLSSTD